MTIVEKILDFIAFYGSSIKFVSRETGIPYERLQKSLKRKSYNINEQDREKLTTFLRKKDFRGEQICDTSKKEKS